MAQGWQYLLEPHGVFAQMGINASGAYHVFFGPAGVVFVLALANAPFAYPRGWQRVGWRSLG